MSVFVHVWVYEVRNSHPDRTVSHDLDKIRESQDAQIRSADATFDWFFAVPS